MTEKFFALIAGGLLAFGKVLELFPTIALVANILSGGFAENFEEEFA